MGRGNRSGMRPNVLEHLTSRILRKPPTVRGAGSVLVTMTAIVVVGGGALMRLVDHREFPDVWLGMWWALQTVTTVGYGDIVPVHWTGRLVGVIVMLQGIAFLTIVTAVITSTFIERARRERAIAELGTPVHDTLTSLDERLARIEQKLDALG